MSPRTRDRVSGLCDQARYAHARAAKLAEAASEHTIGTALALGEAKAVCDAPAWSAFLAETQISEAAARDLLELYRVTLHPRALVDLGGVAVASAWAAKLRLPKEGEVLAVTAGHWSSARPGPVAYIWPVDRGHCAGIANLHDASFQTRMTRVPETRERIIWQCVWNLLGPRHAEMAFRTIAGHDAGLLIDALEVRRRALPRGEDLPRP